MRTTRLPSNVLSNDTPGPLDEDWQTLTVISASAQHGSVTINPDWTLIYVPDARYWGPDIITYVVQDDGTTDGSPDPKTATGLVEVTVAQANDAPFWARSAIRRWTRGRR